MNDIANFALFASVAIVGYMVCRAISPNAGRGWLCLCGAAVGGAVPLGLWAQMFFRPGWTLNGIAVLVSPAVVVVGAIAGWWVTARIVAPKE